MLPGMLHRDIASQHCEARGDIRDPSLGAEVARWFERYEGDPDAAAARESCAERRRGWLFRGG